MILVVFLVFSSEIFHLMICHVFKRLAHLIMRFFPFLQIILVLFGTFGKIKNASECFNDTQLSIKKPKP